MDDAPDIPALDSAPIMITCNRDVSSSSRHEKRTCRNHPRNYCSERDVWYCTLHTPIGECPICFDDICRFQSYTLPCKHQFHRKCLKGWLETGATTCPSCRTQVDERYYNVLCPHPPASEDTPLLPGYPLFVLPSGLQFARSAPLEALEPTLVSQFTPGFLALFRIIFASTET